jgi:hypothetical protein
MKLKETHPDLDDATRLAHCVYAANAHSGPDGLCPLALVFGVQPKLPGEMRHESHRDRIRASVRAREEYAKIMARRRVNLGIRSKPPDTQDIAAGQRVYVHRENDGWSGPHLCMGADGKRAIVDLGESTGPRAFNISRLKLAHMSPPIPDDVPLHTLHHAVYVTEVIDGNDPRAAAFGPAIRKEMMNLIDRGTFRIVMRPERTDENNPNVLPSRFVLAIKRRDSGEEIMKARLVIGGHRDKEKQFRVHTASTMRSTSLRMIMAIASIFGFRLASVDVAQAYLQAAEPLLRDIYVKLPPGTIELDETELVQLLKPLYGLSESGDYWASTLNDVLLSRMNLTQAQSDMTVFFRKLATRLVLIHGSHVDDIIHAAPREELDTAIQELREHFETKEPEYDHFPFAGTDVDGTEYSLSQSGYISRLKKVPIPCSWDTFQSRRAAVAYVKSTRPDIAADISIQSSVTKQEFTDHHADMLNALISRLHQTRDAALQFPKLEWSSLYLLVYTDGSFASRGIDSQIGYAILLADSRGRASLLHFSSTKARRVCRSALTAEALAFVAGVDFALLLKADLQELLGKAVPMLVLTDSEPLFNIITRERLTTEKRLMIDLAAIRESYRNLEISNIGLIASEFNIADALTKTHRAGNSALWHFMCTNNIRHPVRRYIISRDDRQPPSAEKQ